MKFETISIKEKDNVDELISMILKLRKLCWKSELNSNIIDRHIYFDEFDFQSMHFLCYDRNILISSARASIHFDLPLPDYGLNSKIFSNHNWPIGSLNRLVVHPEYRQRGIMKEMDRLRIDYLKHSVKEIIVTCISEVRLKYLLHLGFEISNFKNLSPTMFSEAAIRDNKYYTLIKKYDTPIE